MTDFDDYRWLVGSEAERWLTDSAHSDEPLHSLQIRLRKGLTASRARLVAQQVVLRRKAVEKFGDHADRMFFTDIALQQATDHRIARYKASRFFEGRPTIDYCCGIGGDLIAFADRAPSIGWDRMPEISLFADANLRVIGCNARATVCVGDVEDHPPHSDSVWHLDPDRRVEGRRSTHIQWHSPALHTVQAWLATAPHGAIKLAPATKLSPQWQAEAELEWITSNRQCRQLVAWFGGLSKSMGQHRATRADSVVSSFVGDPRCVAPIADRIGNYVFDTDPAIRAAGLTGSLAASVGCEAIAAGEAYITSNIPVAHAMLSRFQVSEVFPFRPSDVINHIRTLDIGDLEIKTRGVAVQPDELRKKLKLGGSAKATLLLARQGKREIAILAQRDDSQG